MLGASQAIGDAGRMSRISVVIPAHNESSVIARLLGNCLDDPATDEMDVVIVCNGCTDNTADVARRSSPTVRVIESGVASKTNALNLGDEGLSTFPRIYADADIIITAEAIRTLVERLNEGDVLAVAPTPYINLAGCSWAVRQYFAVRSRLPSSHEGIGGSGVYALSEEGRRRFSQFPELIADDMYVRLQFKPNERATLASARSVVFPPRTIAQLLRVRSRAYAGVFELAHRFPALRANRGESNNHALLALFKEPRLWPGLSIYCLVNILARFKATARSRAGTLVWPRDPTSRPAACQD